MTGKLSVVRLFGTMLISTGVLLAVTVRANAASDHVQINNSAILSAKITTNQARETVLNLRLRRGVRGHGHLDNTKVVRITAYDIGGAVINRLDKKISKRQTYVHMMLTPALAEADRLIASVE